MIAKLVQVIKRLDYHMGERVPVSLSDLISDIQIDFPNVKLEYSTIQRWIAKDDCFIYKYSTHKRIRILKQIKIIRERIEELQNELMSLPKIENQSHENIFIVKDENINNQVKPAKVAKHSLAPFLLLFYR